MSPKKIGTGRSTKAASGRIIRESFFDLYVFMRILMAARELMGFCVRIELRESLDVG
jgi:hypothetical protein